MLRLAVLAAAACIVALAATPAGVAVAATGGMAGTVTDSGGPLEEALVCAYEASAEAKVVDCVKSDSEGKYTIIDLPDGEYTVAFYPPAGANYLTQYYSGRKTLEEADVVFVKSEAITAEINAVLQAGGEIAGTVTGAPGEAPLPFIKACAYRLDGSMAACDSTDGEGKYAIVGLTTGQYKVYFYNPPFGYLEEYYHGKLSFEEADPVGVEVEQTTAGIDAALQAGGQITGTIIDASSKEGLKGLYACADAIGSVFSRCAQTGTAGEYIIDGLPTGEYRVRFFSSGGTYTMQYYNGKASAEKADPISLTAGEAIDGIDAELAKPVAGSPAILGESASEVTASSALLEATVNPEGSPTAVEFQYGTTILYGQSTAPQEISGSEPQLVSAPVTELAPGTTHHFRAVATNLSGTTKGPDETFTTGAVSEGEVAGTIRDTGEAPIEGAHACAFNAGGPANEAVGCAEANAAGEYTIGGLPPGEYKVEFFGESCGSEGCVPLISHYYNGRANFNEADPVTVTAGVTTSGVDAEMEEAGSISGTVTNAHGAPIEGLHVCASRSNGEFGGCNGTDAAGEYAIRGLLAGQYRVEFQNQSCGPEGCVPLSYVRQYYDGKTGYGKADLISLSPGDEATGIDAEMEDGGGVSGTVTDAATAGIEHIQVCAYDAAAPGPGESFNCVQTDADGKYTLTGLPAGEYKVQFSGNSCNFEGCFNLDYVMQYWDGKPNFGEADPVSVSAGNMTPGIDATMEDAGRISGTVTDAAAAPIKGMQACAYKATESEYAGEFLGCEQTGASGEYEIAGLPAGSYNVVFQSNSCGPQGCFSLNYVREYYSGRPRGSEADPIAVTAGATTPDIDAELEAGGEVSGAVTDSHGEAIKGVQVCAQDASLNPWEGRGYCTQSSGSGEYTIRGVPAGGYRVQFMGNNSCGPLGCFNLNYVMQYWDGKPSFETADTISVTPEGATPGIDAEMQEGATIEGTVTDTEGAPVANTQVCTREAVGPQFGPNSVCAPTDGSGAYAIRGLPAGEYKVEFQGQRCGGEGCYSLNYIPQYWDDKPSFEEGDTVTVAAGETLGGIDAEMQEGAQISGIVTDNHGMSLQGIQVCAYDASLGEFEGRESTACANTQANGEYVLGGLPPGEYKFSFQDFTCDSEGCYQGNHITEHWNDKPLFSEADALGLNTGDRVENIDVEMQEGAEIAGTVTDSDGAPIARTMVCASQEEGGWFSNCASTRADGTYVIAGLASGEYKVQFGNNICDNEGCRHLNYIPQYWDDKPSFEEGDTVTVAVGETLSGIDAEMQEGAEIHGRLTDASTGEGIRQEEAVCAWSALDGSGWSCSSTNANGEYVLGGLPTGEYIVEFGGGGNYVRQYWDGKPTYGEADALAVTVGEAREINVEMHEGGAIAGTVTDSHGEAISGLGVCAYADEAGEAIACGSSTLDGTYLISGLPEGEYEVEFSNQVCAPFEEVCTSTYYLPQYWEGKGSREEATPVPVTVSGTTAGIDAAMQEGGKISGTVVNLGEEAPLEGIGVCAYEVGGGEGEAAGCAETEEGSGEYSLLLPAGTYRVEFSDPGETHGTQYYDAKATLAEADPVTVAAGETQAGVDATMLPPGPVNTAPPTISGEAREGQTLTESHGTWEGGPTSYAYQWLRCDSAGANCTAISGASAQQYVLSAADVGHRIKVQETATNAGGPSIPASSAATALVVPPPPLNTAPPTIFGKAQQGQTLTEAHGSWTNGPTSYAYQWLRCNAEGESCSAIEGAKEQSYFVKAADVGHKIRAQETASNAGGAGSPAKSAASAEVLPPVPVNLEAPTISGTAQQGQTLSEAHGSWTNSPSSYALQWLRCDAEGGACAAIAGATSSNYVPTAEDVGHKIRVKETASNAGGPGSPATSTPTAAVVPPVPVNTKAPAISGASQEGQALTETHGTWTNGPTSYAYQWLRCDAEGGACTPISGASAQKYVLASSDVGHTIRMEETATNAGGPSSPAKSAATGVVTSTGGIAGHVSDAASHALAGVKVNVYETVGSELLVTSTQTSESGDYAVAGLLPGSYRVDFDRSGYEAKAKTVAVSSAATTEVNVTLTSLTGAIAGTASTAGEGLAGVGVVVYRKTAEASYLVAGSVATGAAGTYTIPGLVPGEYRVEFSRSGYVTQFYNGKTSWGSAETVTVSAAESHAGVDAAMQPILGAIDGTVAKSGGGALAAVAVTVYDNGGKVAGTATSAAGGAYEVKGLLPAEAGTGYRVQFSAGGYKTQFYSGKDLLKDAERVAVAPGKSSGAIDAAMVQMTGAITGKVTDAGEKALAETLVVVYRKTAESGYLVAGSVATGAAGTYTIPSLVPGEYRVEFSRPGYVTQFYNGKTSWGSATSLTVSAGATAEANASMAAATGEIDGTVTAAKSGAPLSGAIALAYKVNGGEFLLAASTATKADGTYAIPGLKGGSYVLEFSAGGYKTQFYSGRSSIHAADQVLVSTSGAPSEANAALGMATGSIAGTVADAAESGIEGIDVTVLAGEGLVASTTTKADGTYTVAGLAPGEYTVEFSATGFVTQFYNGVPSLPEATPVAVGAEATTAGIDATMTAITGSIEGTVSANGGGDPIAGIQAIAYEATEEHLFAGIGISDAAGEYSIAGLESGSYYVEFAPGEEGEYAIQFYDGHATLAAAAEANDAVAVAAPSPTPGIDATMKTPAETSALRLAFRSSAVAAAILPPTAGGISGTVTDGLAGEPIAGSQVVVYEGEGEHLVVGLPVTNAEGRYSVAGLKEGSYRVQFLAAGYETQFFEDRASLATSDPVSVTAGATHEGVDAALQSGAIAGAVTDALTHDGLEGVTVSVYEAGSSEGFIASTATKPDGTYKISGLAAGEYDVAFATAGYKAQFYDGRATLATADAIEVQTGAIHGGIDAALDPTTGSLAGTVTDGKGALANVAITVYDGEGKVAATTETDSEGEYAVSGLPAASFSVQFSATGYETQFYSDEPTLAEADPVTVSAGATQEGIDATLAAELGGIEGTVTDGQGPLANVAITAYDGEGKAAASTATDSEGEYSVPDLPVDSYSVQFSAAGYETQFFDGKATLGDADPVSVTAGATQEDIDATLAAELGGIEGTVTDGQGPLANAVVTAYDGEGKAAASTATDSEGEYSVSGLPVDSYSVQFSAAGYETQFFDGKATLAAADAVAVTAGATQEDIDATLAAELGGIEGTVTDGEGALAGVVVRAYDGEGKVAATAETDSEGEYAVSGLSPGPYRLQFSATGHATEFYEDKATLGAANPVAVTAGEVAEANAELEPTVGAIAGLVTSEVTGEAIEDALVVAYKGGVFAGSTVTGELGKYTLTGLEPGEYVVAFSPPLAEEGIYARQFFHGKATLAAADAVAVTAGATQEDIDATLLPPAPVNLEPPTITGEAREGQTLTETHGTWTHSPSGFTHQWLRCDAAGGSCSAISGATAQTYELTSSDVGHKLRVEETASNAGGPGAPATSAATAVVAAIEAPPSEGGGGGGVGSVPPRPPAPPTAGTATASPTAMVTGHAARITLSCVGTGPCEGTIKLVARVKEKRLVKHHVVRRTRSFVIGRTRFSIAAGAKGVASVQLNGKGMALLRKAGKRGLTVQLTGSGVKQRKVVLKAQQSARGSSGSRSAK